jgi:hypothetical protein
LYRTGAHSSRSKREAPCRGHCRSDAASQTLRPVRIRRLRKGAAARSACSAQSRGRPAAAGSDGLLKGRTAQRTAYR